MRRHIQSNQIIMSLS